MSMLRTNGRCHFILTSFIFAAVALLLPRAATAQPIVAYPDPPPGARLSPMTFQRNGAVYRSFFFTETAGGSATYHFMIKQGSGAFPCPPTPAIGPADPTGRSIAR